MVKGGGGGNNFEPPKSTFEAVACPFLSIKTAFVGVNYCTSRSEKSPRDVTRVEHFRSFFVTSRAVLRTVPKETRTRDCQRSPFPRELCTRRLVDPRWKA